MDQPSLFDTGPLHMEVAPLAYDLPLPVPQATVQETLPAYSLYLKQTTDSLYTADDFTGDLRKLGGYLGQKAISRITLADLEQWINRLASPTGEHLTAKTVSRKVAAIKNYFRWLASHKVITADPSARLITQRITSPLPTVLYAEECQRLLQTASCDPRAYLLILLLLETGIKKAELLALRTEHFDFSDPYSPVLWIKYTGKKALKSRKLQLPAAIMPVFADYRTRYIIQEKLFPYTPRLIEYILTATAARAGITKKVTAQILRDTCAVRLLNRGQPLERVLLKLGLNPSTWEDAKVKYGKLTAPAR